MLRMFLSLSETRTSFSPAPTHFLVQSACVSLAPLSLRAHFSSASQPAIFCAFGALSLANENDARHAMLSRVNATFFIISFSPGVSRFRSVSLDDLTE